MNATEETAGARTQAALEAGGFADMRPTYRALLRRLKTKDAAAFAEATKRYEDVLVPAVTGGADPVAAWADYGTWIARRLGAGRVVRLDESGLARSAGDTAPTPGEVLLFLPDAPADSAIPIAAPEDPSPAQAAALRLLAR